jgi:hypothetical protein
MPQLNQYRFLVCKYPDRKVTKLHNKCVGGRLKVNCFTFNLKRSTMRVYEPVRTKLKFAKPTIK